MHVVVIFHHVGGYHAARLRAVHDICKQQGLKLTVVQVTDRTSEHPWGELNQEITFPCKTLLPAATSPKGIDRSSQSVIAASLLKTELSSLKPNLLAIPGWGFPISRTALAWCRRHQVPNILMSESKADDQKRYWWKEQLKSWLYVRNFDAALVGGELHRRYLVELGMPANHIFLGYDAVDNDYFATRAEVAKKEPDIVRSRQQAIPKKPYFLAATRLIQRKNMLNLVQAFSAYRDTVGEKTAWDLVICGKGEEETRIRKFLVEKNLLECVHLPSFITYRAIADWYGLAHAFIHPALQEQWGLVVNEACAASLPILCSHTVGACHELVQENHNGFLFNPESKSEITQALIKMHHLEKDTRLSMGKASQNIVSMYGPKEFAQGFFSAINIALKQKK